ncbi:MAG: hypothetical protein JNJ88_16480 [Planctomycetes bacterium]|nr:hypothetical protein [Planctomycetota bacterium]
MATEDRIAVPAWKRASEFTIRAVNKSLSLRFQPECGDTTPFADSSKESTLRVVFPWCARAQASA